MISKLKENLNGDPVEITLQNGSITHGIISQVNDDKIKLEILNTPEPATLFKEIKIADIKDVEVLEPFDPFEDEDILEYYRTEYGDENNN